MKHFFSILLVAFFSTTVFAQTVWKADPAHTQVNFGIVHLGISEIKGRFNEFDSQIEASKDDFSDAKYQMTIEVSSIDTGVEMRDDHLRSADFFNVEKHQKMTFKSTSSKKVSENKYQVSGNLSFNGVTKPITLDVWYRGTTENKENGEIISGFAIFGEVKRSDYNLGSKFPEAVLSDKVAINVNGEFKKQ